MSSPGQEPRQRRLVLTLVSTLGLLALVINLAWVDAGQARDRPAPGSQACVGHEGFSPRSKAIICETDVAPVAFMAQGATPVARPDPLDGDPLDGPARRQRPPEPENASRLTIVQSGRQKDTPDSTVLYDGNAGTGWAPAAIDEPWVWFDLGDTATVRLVRWLAAGDGEVEIAVSRDRKQWSVLDSQVIIAGWQEITLREDAQYVRLTLLPDRAASPVELAEVEIFGRQRRADVAVAQESRARNEKRDTRERRRAQRAQQADTAADAATSNGSVNGGERGSVNASAKAGKTNCRGKRERCRARPGKIEVTDDCGGNGTCTIDIRADGGSAMCDAAGGNENEAGRGEGKRGGGDGGRCEAVADGGTITIGDVNP